MDENEKTVLVAVNSNTKEARLLPYTLANVEELIELAFGLSEERDIPEDLRAELIHALGPFAPIDTGK
jgi:hypothetical protein